MREKLQGELRQDRQELFNKMDGIARSLEDKMDVNFQAMNTKFEAMNTKIDSTKSDISLQAGVFALGGATLAVSLLGFFFEKKVAVVDIQAAPAAGAVVVAAPAAGAVVK